MTVDVPPPALPPPAVSPPAPHVVDVGPNSSKRKEITNWLQKIHQQIGHRDNRTLVKVAEATSHTSMGFEDGD